MEGHKSKHINLFYDLIQKLKKNEKELFADMLSDLDDVFISHVDDEVFVDEENNVFKYVDVVTKNETKVSIDDWLNEKFSVFYKKYTVESSKLFKSLEGENLLNVISDKKKTIYDGLSIVKRPALKKEWVEKFDKYFDFITSKYLFNKHKAHSLGWTPRQLSHVESIFDELCELNLIHSKTELEDFVTFFSGYCPIGNIYFKGSKSHLYFLIKALASKANASSSYLVEITNLKKLWYVGDNIELITNKISKNSKNPPVEIVNNITRILRVLD